jgi:hypothetical protein
VIVTESVVIVVIAWHAAEGCRVIWAGRYRRDLIGIASGHLSKEPEKITNGWNPKDAKDFN